MPVSLTRGSWCTPLLHSIRCRPEQAIAARRVTHALSSLLVSNTCSVRGSAEMTPLDETVDAARRVDVEGLDGFRAADVLVELRRVRARLAAVEARLIARVETARGRGPTTATWARASWLAGVRPHVAGGGPGDVRLARRLRSMPATARALAAGDITLAHARRLATLYAPDTAGGVRRGRGVPGGSGPLDAVGRLHQGAAATGCATPAGTRPRPRQVRPRPPQRVARTTGCAVPGCCPVSSPPPPRPRSVPSSAGSNGSCSRPTGPRPRPAPARR